MPDQQLRAAIIIEDANGNRTIYRLIPKQLDIWDRRFDGRNMQFDYIGPPDYAIALEGTLVDGKVWTGEMPQDKAISFSPPAIEQRAPIYGGSDEDGM